MSRINQDVVKKSIHDMVEGRKDRKKHKNFIETVELQIALRDYDPEKEKRFAGSIRLPHRPYPRKTVAIIGTAFHCQQAQKEGIPFIDVEGLKKFNKERKPIKKWAAPFDQLIASESLMKQIPKLLGNVLNKINKFPIVIGETESVKDKVEEIRSTVKFQLKKVLCMGTAVGTLDLNEEDLRQNINLSINFLISLLKKGWYNVKNLHIKTTQGPSFRVFG